MLCSGKYIEDYDKTLYFYEKYLKYFPTTAEGESDMVSFYMNKGQVKEALPHMLKALDLDPNVNNAERMQATLRKYDP
tara:strand:+ start:64 stop:297 length:234 start_codon:yes stop_codon:yes gene_type:complete